MKTTAAATTVTAQPDGLVVLTDVAAAVTFFYQQLNFKCVCAFYYY